MPSSSSSLSSSSSCGSAECLLLTDAEVSSLISEGWTYISGPYNDQNDCLAVCCSSSSSGASSSSSYSSSSGPCTGTQVYDSFTDVDGTLLPDHTPDIYQAMSGYTWNNGISSCLACTTIQGNQARVFCVGGGCSGGGIIAETFIGSGCVIPTFTTHVYQVDVMLGGLIQLAGLCPRSGGNSGFWYYYLNNQTQQVEFYKGNGTNITAASLVTSVPYTVLLDTWYTLKVIDDGTTFTCYVNGVSEFTYTDSYPFNSGGGGISVWIPTAGSLDAIYFDNFHIDLL